MLLSFTIIIITTLGLTSITVVGLAGDRIVLAQPKNPQQEDEDILITRMGMVVIMKTYHRAQLEKRMEKIVMAIIMQR